MTIRPDIELANNSDVGCVRSDNEDYYVFIEPQSDDEFEKRGRLILVADGMGGCKGGRIASRLAGDTIRNVFLAAREEDPMLVLMEGFHQAHEAIQEHAIADGELGNMGTTCTAIVLRGERLTVGHIGDSRLYLIRDGKARRLSTDHTVVAQMLAKELITEEESLTHEKRHVLSAALGVGQTPEADFFCHPDPIQERDILLLCSDGLHGLITDGELASATLDQSVDEACAELLAWAKVRGGPDNITLQLLRIVQVNSASPTNEPSI